MHRNFRSIPQPRFSSVRVTLTLLPEPYLKTSTLNLSLYCSSPSQLFLVTWNGHFRKPPPPDKLTITLFVLDPLEPACTSTWSRPF